jgi:MFS family permease
MPLPFGTTLAGVAAMISTVALPPAVPRLTNLCLGLSQLVCWGISYYMIGALGESIVADTGWSGTLVYGGFSAALVVMGLSSPLIGRMIDRRGGRPVMVAGSILIAAGCVDLALAYNPAVYVAAWLVLGVAMRMTLYDAAFASLARIAGPQARRVISQITLLGGLASTAFWPIGHFLDDRFGWRAAVLVYAVIAILTIPLHLSIPPARYVAPASADPRGPGTSITAGGGRIFAGTLYALIVTLVAFLNSGLSAHLIGILAGLGLTPTVAVWIATLGGIGQTSARIGEILFGGRLHPLALGIVATGLIVAGFAAGLLSGRYASAAIVFAVLFGFGKGLLTIVRGTLPLVLFEHHVYGALVGRLLMPSFFLSAFGPLAYALLIERFGDRAALLLSLAIGVVILGAAILLRLRFGSSRR